MRSFIICLYSLLRLSVCLSKCRYIQRQSKVFSCSGFINILCRHLRGFPRRGIGPSHIHTPKTFEKKTPLFEEQNTIRVLILHRATSEIDVDRLCKGENVPVLAMKAYRGSRGVAPLILNIGARCS